MLGSGIAGGFPGGAGGKEPAKSWAQLKQLSTVCVTNQNIFLIHLPFSYPLTGSFTCYIVTAYFTG